MSRPGFIDTHAHLCDDRFDEDREAVLERACQAGVVGIVLVSETLADARLNGVLARQFPRLYLAAGLYPGQAEQKKAEEMVAYIHQYHQQLLAIGEVGLDFLLAKEEPQRAVQRQVFSTFIQLSLQLDLPLNVHSRSAAQETVATLLDSGAKRVQLHAYHGDHKTALKAIEAGYYLSVPTSIVRSEQIRNLVKKLPLDQLLLESDSPVLGPDPGLRNEPANIARSVPLIAQMKGVPEQEVVEQLHENSCQLYGVSFPR
ncbi:MAG: TatD family hydrolase [Magnetococcales bacterium]|nr:TatD family hydrolase [Magnetococcales bacterium]